MHWVVIVWMDGLPLLLNSATAIAIGTVKITEMNTEERPWVKNDMKSNIIVSNRGVVVDNCCLYKDSRGGHNLVLILLMCAVFDLCASW